MQMQDALLVWPGSFSITINLVLAVLLGTLIGIERQWRQRLTGLTTHAMVSLGAAAFTSLALLATDPVDVRIGGQVVTGVGFLGAGLIMRDGLSVRGLSGAATVWATGAIGTLAGYGYRFEAIEATVLMLLINFLLPKLRSFIGSLSVETQQSERFYTIELKCAATDEAVVRTMLLHAMPMHKLKLQGIESHALPDHSGVEVEASVYSKSLEDDLVERLVGQLCVSPKIYSASWTSAPVPE